MGTLLVSRGCHPGLMELALQAGVAGGEAGLMGVREVLWNCCFGNGDNPA
jgi:hypothetical protein